MSFATISGRGDFGHNTIGIFDAAEDLIEVNAGFAGGFDALLALLDIENSGTETVFNFSNGDVLTLEGVSISDLSVNPFSFLA